MYKEVIGYDLDVNVASSTKYSPQLKRLLFFGLIIGLNCINFNSICTDSTYVILCKMQ